MSGAHCLYYILLCAGEWLVNQNAGELDDMRLVDGVTGDTLVYKRRGEPDQQLGLHQQRPVSACTLAACYVHFSHSLLAWFS